MTLLIAYDTTGPCPADHEIIQVGGVFCSDDLVKVYTRFGTYIQPEKNLSNVKEDYIRFLGMHGIQDLKQNKKYWSDQNEIWSHFLDLVKKYARENLEESPLKNTRIVVFDASSARDFLSQSMSGIPQYDSNVLRYVGGLVQTTMDYSAFKAYKGRDIDLHQNIRWVDEKQSVWEQILQFYNVDVTNLNDAVERASAIRSCYFKLFDHWKSSSKNKSYGRRQSRSTGRSNPVTRQD